MPTVAARQTLDLGASLIAFRLPEPLTGRLIGPDDFQQAGALVVAFLANQRPQVEAIADSLATFARDWDSLGLQLLGVNSAEAEDGADEGPAATAGEALKRGYVFPYLIDQTRAVAKAYAPAAPPAFFLFDHARRLAYRGGFDGLREAAESVLTWKGAGATDDAIAPAELDDLVR